jgi:CRISPR-associated protein Csd2
MGRKNTVPYGVYVAHGFVSAHLAEQTGFGEDDLALLWDALVNMFEHDRSAARGLMSTQKLIIYKNDSALGNAPAHTLFKRVNLSRKDDSRPARDFSDYILEIDKNNLPAGVEIIELPN